jgi:FkbM family methyltransferase
MLWTGLSLYYLFVLLGVIFHTTLISSLFGIFGKSTKDKDMSSIGYEEIRYLEYMKQMLNKDNPVLCDIGFYIGEYTDKFLEHFPNGRVWGFEPNAKSYGKAVLKFKGNDRVNIANMAVGYYDGVAELYCIESGNEGMSSLYFRDKYFPQMDCQTKITEVITLDDDVYFSQTHMDIVKIDTEGSEFDVLKGMDYILDTIPPKFIQLEVGETYLDAGITFRQVIEYLYAKRYIVYNRNFDIISPNNVTENYDVQNYLAEYIENERMMPELGNLCFGNPGRVGRYEVERDWGVVFDILMGSLNGDCYGVDYENDIFEIHPYYWGECTCEDQNENGYHTPDCLLMRPNFVYKPTGYKLEWYKYAMRDAYANMDLSIKEFAEMVLHCANSVEKEK